MLDQRLVRRLQAGDTQAFETLVNRHKDRVLRMLVRILGDRQEAEDVAQDVFIAVFRHIHRFRGDARFQTWLLRIAANACRTRLKYLKRRAHDRRISLSQGAEDSQPSLILPSTVPTPEALAMGTRLEAAIADELTQLDPEHRLLIVLRDVEGLPYDEVARVTGLAIGTVKSRLHRARTALKNRVKPHLR